VADVLVAKGLITPGERDWAMAAPARTGSSLSVILIGAGLVRRHDLDRALADTAGVPLCDLTVEPIDQRLLAGLDPEQLTREGWIPVRALPDGSILVAGCHAPEAAPLSSMERALGRPVTGYVQWWNLLTR
jgi:glycosyltransferase XagB